MDTALLDLIFKYIGMVSVISFVLVGLGDFVVASINIILKHTASPDDDARGQKIAFWWDAIKEIYEEFRKFIDKFSTFSRPRQ